MLYPRNVPFFHSPEASIAGVISPISFPVIPAFLSASATSLEASVSLYVTVSRSIVLNGVSLIPRFFVSPPITSSSAAVRFAASSCALSDAAAFSTRAFETAILSGRGFPVYSAILSAFMAAIPSLLSAPNAEPTSLFSMPSPAAISGRRFGPFSLR